MPSSEREISRTLEDQKPLDINDILEASNVVDLLSEETLMRIGEAAFDGYDADMASRKPWEKDLTSWTKLALQISDEKTFPWPNAANIKFPLLATAAMQFAARAYPALVPSLGDVVKCKVIGRDLTGEKAARAKRVSIHMSNQVMNEMEDWEEDMDKLLIALPIAGTCFKKTYWDANKQKNCSKLVLPKYLVVNNTCRSLEEAERITEVLFLTRRQVKERQNRKVYADIQLDAPGDQWESSGITVNRSFQLDNTDDVTSPYTILEQHTYLDLDDDGYSEPYIVTLEEASHKVLRIVPRFTEDDVIVNEKDMVVSVEAIQYYTKYSFIPNPDGGFYDIGFGRLLGPINESANTIINQLVDAGSLSNLQSGFIGKGLRMKMGEARFQPGEWKAVNATGDDIKKQIFPLPVREPSNVLFQLLELLLKSGKELASVAEIMTGKMPGQNTPATTTMASIDQGMKVFTAVYKRVYRSLAKEFRKMYKLNKTYLNPEEYIAILDDNIQQSDYEGAEDDIIPGADPTAISPQEKQGKAQALMQILQLGTIDPMFATQMYLDAHEIPNAEKAIKQPSPPPPDPKVELMKTKAQLETQKAQRDMQMKEREAQLREAGMQQDLQMKAASARQDADSKNIESILKARAGQQGLQQKAAEGQLKLVTSALTHEQKMKQQKENKPKAKELPHK